MINPPWTAVDARIRTIHQLLTQVSLPLLRVSLGVVFIWFGALKFTDSTPVADLVARTVPFLPSHWFVPALGGFEVILGLGLLIGRRLAIVALLMVAHLSGTFLVLVTQPDVAFQHGNPVMLTMTGEFVVKNVVLITAGLVLIGRIHGAAAPEPGLTAAAPAPGLIAAAAAPGLTAEPAEVLAVEPAEG
jgi:uncharacterized membrane protein YkgB